MGKPDQGGSHTTEQQPIHTALISGGAGTLGRHLCDILLGMGVVVRVLDNNEDGLYRLRERYIGRPEYQRIRLFHGDVTDRPRVTRAMEGADTVIHAAALKHVWLGEANPMQVFKVNVEGTQNVIEAALDEGKVQTVIFTSSDKAVNPSNIYGQSKAMGEGLILNANHVKGDRPTAFSVFRSGNFYGSRGSVIEKWNTQAEREEPLTLVRGDFKRFFIGTWDAARLCVEACRLAKGGEIFIPKMKEYSIQELAKLMSGNIKWIDPGLSEKLSEELYTPEEGRRLEDLGEIFRVGPA